MAEVRDAVRPVGIPGVDSRPVEKEQAKGVARPRLDSYGRAGNFDVLGLDSVARGAGVWSFGGSGACEPAGLNIVRDYKVLTAAACEAGRVKTVQILTGLMMKEGGRQGRGETMTIDEIVARYPRLNFLMSPAFETLSEEKKKILLGCVEDAHFWIELEKKPQTTDGFKFLAAAFGLQKAEAEANAKGLTGQEREKHIQPHLDLHSMFNPHYGIDGSESRNELERA